jgi:hypothetical protein
MIKETVKIHDRYQFEIKQAYNLSRGGKRDCSYFVQTYFFVPHNLNINRDTYNAEAFYRDLRATVRLQTPSISLGALAAGNAILERLRASIDGIRKGDDTFSASDCADQAKMLCLIYKKAVTVHLRIIEGTRNKAERKLLVREYIESVRKFTHDFRQLLPLAIKALPEDERMAFLFADEYMSLKTESHTCLLNEILREKDRNLASRFNAGLMEIVVEETAHRKKHDYPSIPEPGGDNEMFVFRQGALKKFLSNVLYLETRTERWGALLEHAMYSIAAGVAMLFATVVVFIGQSRYGSLSIPFFIALVISYMFKDRIKEILRLYLSSTLHKWLFDRRRNIYHGFHDKIGICRESFNILDEGKVPDAILTKRARDSITDIDNGMIGEDIVLYRKYISLRPGRLRAIRRHYSTSDVIDIMRFNIQDFLRSMDNPDKKIFIPKGSGYLKGHGKRVYHINIITHFIVDKKDYVRRFRIVLNREGIRRIEEVK